MRRKARLERESQEEAIRIQVVFLLSLENKFSMKVKNFVCEQLTESHKSITKILFEHRKS